MANKQSMNGFRDDEIVTLRYRDKREERWVENSYPKVGGRLRLAHEQNESLAVNTEIVKYDETLPLVDMEFESADRRWISGRHPAGGLRVGT